MFAELWRINIVMLKAIVTYVEKMENIEGTMLNSNLFAIITNLDRL